MHVQYKISKLKNLSYLKPLNLYENKYDLVNLQYAYIYISFWPSVCLSLM